MRIIAPHRQLGVTLVHTYTYIHILKDQLAAKQVVVYMDVGFNNTNNTTNIADANRIRIIIEMLFLVRVHIY